MKIAFSGVQCTGKSTAMKALEELNILDGYDFEYEVVRKLKDQIKINEDGDDATQIAIVNAHLENLQIPNLVTDRCILDCFAYTIYLLGKERISRDTFTKIADVYSKAIDLYDIIFYIKPEFEMVEDGTRSTNSEFRNEVLGYFDELVSYRNNVVILTGTVEERVNQIKEALDALNELNAHTTGE